MSYLKSLLGSALSGVKGLIVQALFDILWNRLLKPYIEHVIRRIKAKQNEREAKKKAQKLKEAKNESDFDSASDDIP